MFVSHFLNQKWYLFYFFRIHVFRFDNGLQVLSGIIQLIVNVAINGSESFYNVRNLTRLFNSMCKRINKMGVFNLRKSFNIRNGIAFKYLKGILGSRRYIM